MIKRLYQTVIPEKLRFHLAKFRHRLQSLMYQSGEYYCPCCEKNSSTFLKKGNGLVSRNNAVCPHCRSLERTRLLYLFLKNERNYLSNQPSILHFAPEDSLKNKMKENPHYKDGDINPLLAAHVMDIQDIPLPENSQDLIICSHVLGHIPDEEKALSEMYRVLKPEGELLLMTLLNQEGRNTVEHTDIKTPEERLKYYGERDLLRLHGQDELRTKMKNAGFSQVQVLDYRTQFSPEDQKKISLGNGERELLFIAIK